MRIEKLTDRYFGENTYIICDEKTNKCGVIDPGGNANDLLGFLKRENLSMEYIILTHGHGDHIAAVRELKSKTNVKVVAHTDERELLLDAKKNLSNTMRCGSQEFDADIYVNDKDKMEIGSLKLSFIHTPGHTKGCMCIRVENHMFTGDTLFAGSIGRTDLYSGDFRVMQKTLKKLAKYEDNVSIYPGHGPSSTLGIEKMSNPYMG